MEKQKKVRKTKLVIKDKKRFITSMLIISFLILIVIILCVNIVGNSNSKKGDSNLSKLNPKKNSSQLQKKYDTVEMKKLFLSDYTVLQNNIGIYIMNNSTMDSNSFSSLIANINKELKKDTWNLGEIQNKPTSWNGKWFVTEEGILKFSFSNKDIEPSWVKDSDVLEKIDLN